MSRRILVVDDEQGIRAALGQLLEFELGAGWGRPQAAYASVGCEPRVQGPGVRLRRRPHAAISEGSDIDADDLRQDIFLSINGIAAAMQSTG